MSDGWKELYEKRQADCVQLRQLAFERELRILQLESQRRSLIAHLRMAGADLLAADRRIVGPHYIEVADRLERSYVEEGKPEQTVGEVSPVEGAVPGHPEHPRCAPVHTEAGTTVDAPF